MSAWEHSRFQIWNQAQHPYKHPASDFEFIHPSLPGVTSLEASLNWILAVLYPNQKDAVATPGDLPAVGNSILDYRVVTDDGDGKAASYRWEQREGDVAAKWYKIYDMDWGETTILSNFLAKTQDVYVYKYGLDDRDSDGNLLAGVLAGQHIYGGDSAGTHLTLHANSGDGTGAQTGFVQLADQLRPTANDTVNLGTVTEAFKNLYLTASAVVSTMTVATGSITDSSGAISFGDENLSTTGTFSGGTITGTSLVADDTSDQLTIAPGTITCTTGAISFGDENLSTTGTLASGTHTIGTLSLAAGVISDTSGQISFSDENLLTTGNITGNIGNFNQLNSDNLRLDGNTISSQDVDGNIILSPNGSGIIDAQATLQTLGITTTGTHGITGQLNVDNLRLDGNTISSTDVDGNITISPNGAGVIIADGLLRSLGNGADDLGAAVNRWKDLYLSGNVSDGTDSISMATLLSFRNALVGVTGGETLFYNNGTGLWEASVPDSEVDHTQISNITTGDAGHTQFVMLAGRAGGQAIQGDTQASGNLILESTANATKGNIFLKDTTLPFTNASYSGGWLGADLGGTSNYFRNLYSKGEHIGLRLENVTSGALPSSSSQNIGRLVYTTDTGKIYVDTGTALKVAGVAKHTEDLVFNGSDTVKNVDVSANIVDARYAIKQLLDNANDFEVMGVSLKATSASNIRITTTVPLPAGTYRLIVME